ncbi:PREDICTED: uncharacterized protein LOC107094636 [Cyprinodon variegatus]|uniref:uncharacterized protein LOC107094636 n=1 Tax=Cyprinodon variegatus TaxID=28743 RepID=UPI000742BFA2|nr:PREDICTED: uncharacterized protein LOC107094636 [Cyprinodon variegatus]
MESKVIEVATLGRPFSLGMLYDCREDTVIPGLTLWNRDDLEKDKRETPKPNSCFEIVASESIEDKSSALDVEASLKASFLGGLVKVEGSAKYLNDQVTSKNQARVTLKYKASTKFEELSMNHLGRGNVKHPYVFENRIATHVVTGILYGAQAFFVFDQEKSETESHQDIRGNLKVLIEKIPCLSIEGKGSLHLEDKDTEKIKKFSCKFHGDFLLEKTPTTFQDAVEIYQNLPKLLGANGEKAVPIKVWMLPLTNLDSSAAKLVREISVGLVQEVQSVLEEFSELEIRCNDTMKNNTAQQFPQIYRKLQSFKSMCSEFRLGFQQTLAKKLPSIQGGGEEESELAEILKKKASSPFNSKTLNEWMDCKEREINILKSFTKMMKNTKIIPSPNTLDEELLTAEYAVCFVFTSLERGEPYLSALQNYLKSRNQTDDSHTNDVEKDQWYLSNNVADEMRTKVKLFSDFAEANSETKGTTFLTVALADEKHEGSTIYLYKDGFPVSKNFEPPSKPETVTEADINHNSVTLNISPPLHGAENITFYSVEYRVRGQDEWNLKTEPKSARLTVNNLKPNTEYEFKCRAITSAGVGPANILNYPIKTLPCSPPGEPQCEPNSSELSVSWQEPAELGPDVQILSYIVEYASTADKGKVENLSWSKTRSRGEKVIISGLLSETQYAVRVLCDCGGAGRSKESKIVQIHTTRREFARLAEHLKDISKRTNSRPGSVYELPLKEDDLDIDGCRRYLLGKESLRPNCTIMLLGATGAGKSTLINGMINYIVGVEWNDSFRFKLIKEDSSKSQAHSQTSEVSVYQINHQDGFQIPYSLTVIDTPGFGDTRGVERDQEITEQIRRIFTSADGVTEIDAVCFVTQASLGRLTATQKYVFDSVLSIFGKDVAENIVMLVTFADGKQPPVLEAINVSGVPCPKNDLGFPVHFKFNNSALFAQNKQQGDSTVDEDSDEEGESFDEMFWKMGIRSMEKFFTSLGKMTSKSLLMTKEVLKQRKQLETVIEGLQPQVKAGLAKLEEIKTTKEKIKEHEAIITSNENFEIEVDVIKPIQIPITEKGAYITNCQRCNITCHYPCMIANDNKKQGCAAMDQTGMCTVCPGKCIWNVHSNQTYRWDYVQTKERKTVPELKSKYEKAAKQKLTTEQLIERQEEEIAHLQDLMISLIDQSANCITRLQEISLRPNPLAAPDYIDMMIKGEEAEAKPGYKARIKSLEGMKEKAKLMSKVSQRDQLTKTDEQLSAERQKRKEEKGFLKKVANFFGY